MTDFTMTTDADGVATITWDTVGKSMNVMNQQGFYDLDALIDEALADDKIKGVILTSGKEGSFAGGMDLNIIAKMKESAGDNPAKGLMDGLMETHKMLRKIERGGMDDKRRQKQGRQTDCLRHARHRAWHRLRNPAGLPPHLRGR